MQITFTDSGSDPYTKNSESSDTQTLEEMFRDGEMSRAPKRASNGSAGIRSSSDGVRLISPKNRAILTRFAVVLCSISTLEDPLLVAVFHRVFPQKSLKQILLARRR